MKTLVSLDFYYLNNLTSDSSHESLKVMSTFEVLPFSPDLPWLCTSHQQPWLFSPITSYCPAQHLRLAVLCNSCLKHATYWHMCKC